MNLLSDFAKRIRSPESMAIFNKMAPEITKIAGVVIDATKKQFSDSQYRAPNELIVTWVSENRFQAEASYRDAAGTQHCISIWDGLSKLLYMDSFLIPVFCERHLTEDRYAELFELSDYGDGPRQVMPKDLSKTDCKLGFFTNAMMWVYLHEQAHLFQRHSEVFANGMGTSISDQKWTWQEAWNSSADEPASGKAAELKHVFELSADHEATNLLIQYLLLHDKGRLRQSSLWLLGLALTCIFKRFYGLHRPPQMPNAQGSHPSAAIRMRFTVMQLISQLTHPDVKKSVPWAEEDQIFDILMHAFNVGNIYMEISHGNAEFPEFMARFGNDSEGSRMYVSNLAVLWGNVRPEVAKRHFGFGPGSILPPFAS